MVFDYSKLLGKIKEVFRTQGAFARAMGMSNSVLSMRLNNKADFSGKEICRACTLLGIAKEEISLYFFTIVVQKAEQ